MQINRVFLPFSSLSPLAGRGIPVTPVRRVDSLDTWVAWAPQVERAILPEPEDVFKVIQDIKAF